MAPHQQRVVDELAALSEKRSKLGLFYETPTFKSLPGDEQNRLYRQYQIMVQYEAILQERIDNFPT